MKDSTRDKILEAALKVFSEKGYLGATTKEIATRADVAEITLFRHFSSKEMLFEKMINTYSFLPVLKDLIPKLSEIQYEDALIKIAEKFIETLTERKDMIRIINFEMFRYPQKMHETYHSFIDEIIETLASYFAKMQKRRILKKFDPELGARAFLGMFFSYFNMEELMMRRRYRETDTEKAVKEFIKIFVNGTMK